METFGRSFRARSIRVLIVIVSAVAASSAVAGPRTAITASHLDLCRELHLQIDQMLKTSPTFRAQYRRLLDSPHVTITARIAWSFMQGSFRARSTIQRYSTGSVVVHMEIRPGDRQHEWIAHEFEHVLEYLDGLDLTALADQRAPGVWYSNGAMIETSRAVRAGRTVMEEMRASGRRSDNLVE